VYTEPLVCKNVQCAQGKQAKFHLHPEESAFVDWQRLRVQENADEIPAVLTHSLTHSLTHLLTHSLTDSLTQFYLLTHLLTHSLTYSLRVPCRDVST
jgi:DNA replicative helicase MCM subunit Mcm2 (Cdc46/Mcm family)